MIVRSKMRLDELKTISRSPVDSASLAVFRIVVGCTFAVHFMMYLSNSWVEYFYSSSVFKFKYYGFHWVQPMDADSMRLLYQCLIVVSIGVAVGFAYR